MGSAVAAGTVETVDTVAEVKPPTALLCMRGTARAGIRTVTGNGVSHKEGQRVPPGALALASRRSSHETRGDMRPNRRAMRPLRGSHLYKSEKCHDATKKNANISPGFRVATSGHGQRMDSASRLAKIDTRAQTTTTFPLFYSQFRVPILVWARFSHFPTNSRDGVPREVRMPWACSSLPLVDSR